MQPIEDAQMVLPAYAGACVSNIVPALMEYDALGRGWIPDHCLDAERIVLFVIDGLGWNQLAVRTGIAPVLAASEGTPITTVAPSTTASALTSLATGAAPGEHGLVGYKVRVAGETLNTLRWTTETGDARARIEPSQMQPLPPFGNRSPVVVTRAEFAQSGFTAAHLDGVRLRGYSTVATLVHEVRVAADEGERFVYAYYDGLDRVGHERGHGAAFDAELAFVDRLVGDLRSVLDDSVCLLATADHGQVDCGERLIPFADTVMRSVDAVSGEPRFVWLHARAGRAAPLLEDAQAAHGGDAWVLSVDEVLDRRLLGPHVTSAARSRLGDVAVLARTAVAFVDPAADAPVLRGRHGSVTADEMYVPLVCPVG